MVNKTTIWYGFESWKTQPPSVIGKRVNGALTTQETLHSRSTMDGMVGQPNSFEITMAFLRQDV